MCHKQNLQRTIVVIGAAICVFLLTPVLASSVSATSGLFVNDPSKILMVDGADRNSTVTIGARLGSPDRATFDFGFMDASLYVPITSESCTKGTYTFPGNSNIDFALRNKGTDGLFGTADDLIYRQSDSANYAQEHYFSAVKPYKSRKSGNTQVYFRDLRLSWDLDHDGKPDARTLIEIRGGRYDGMLPVATAVPLPAAMWCFGSGLLGLAAVVRGSSKFRSSYG